MEMSTQHLSMSHQNLSTVHGSTHYLWIYMTKGHIARIVLDEVQVILEVSITRIQRPYSNVYHTVEVFQA